MTAETQTRVMLVDDHSIMRDLLKDALENTGEFRVVAQAADGQEALRLVQEAAPEASPDVIVMDVIMPEMDGIEACRQITELLPDTRVLMLTASNEQDAIVRSIAAGPPATCRSIRARRSCWPPCGRSLRANSGSRGTPPGDCPGRCAVHLVRPRPTSWAPSRNGRKRS